ncbi:MAG: hypothetical protein OEV92_06215 [Nitrospinota bacterium]|nr:hypothetical protein [Nitrospinota bacterium]
MRQGGIGQRIWDHHRNLLLIAMAGAIFAMDGVYLLYKGAKTSSDSMTYSAWADLMISKNFSAAAFLKESSFVVPPVFYLGWVYVVALFKTVLGPSWGAGVAIMNLFMSALICFLVFSIVSRVTNSLISVATAFLLSLVCYEYHLWVPFALSDISYTALSTWIFYLLVSLHSSKDGRIKIALAISFFAMFSMIYRPSATPIVVAAIIGGAIIYFAHAGALARRASFARRLISALVLIFAIVSAGHALVMKETSLWPFSFAKGWIKQLSGEYHAGIVVFSRPETYDPPPVNASDFFAISMKKLAYFCAIDSQSFSRSHRVVNYLFFAPAYLLAALALGSILSPKSHLTEREWMAGLLCFITLLCYIGFHGLQQVDFDWRYRLPCVPLLIILAAIGMAELTARLRGAENGNIPRRK